MRLGLILSNDWELYGDGSGDFWDIQHRRLSQMLDAADSVGAKITVMAEVGQQWAHQRIAIHEKWAQDVVGAWEGILVETLRRGSDVQLHLHPQWLEARREAGRWILNFENWAFSSLSPEIMTSTLKRAKTYLESLLQPVRAEYRTVLFRAGAFCIEPASEAIKALRKAGLLADTSVTKGLCNPRFYDYRHAPSHVLPWQVGDSSVTQVGDSSEIVEIPILSTAVWDFPLLRRYGSLHYTRFLSPSDKAYLARCNSYMTRQYPQEQRPMTAPRRTPLQRVSRAFQALGRPHRISLDYDSLPAPVFTDCLERLIEDPTLQQLDRDTILPVMALGHSKTIPDVDNFQRMLEQVVRRLGDQIVFWTGQNATEYWSQRLTAAQETGKMGTGDATLLAA
jgi:hypothetical protein